MPTRQVTINGFMTWEDAIPTQPPGPPLGTWGGGPSLMPPIAYPPGQGPIINPGPPPGSIAPPTPPSMGLFPGQLPASQIPGWVFGFVPGYGWGWAYVPPQQESKPAEPTAPPA